MSLDNPLRSPSQIEEAAKAIWKAMLDGAKKNGTPLSSHKGAQGYFINGSVSASARKIWPRTDFKRSSGKTAMNMIRTFLRNTGNVIVLESLPNRRQSKIFISSVWIHKEAILVPFAVPTRAQTAAANRDKEARRLEAKVTPEEAGETREPAPIQIREGFPVHPEYGPSEQHPDYVDVLRYTNGVCQCRKCGKVLKPQGLAPHMKMHLNESLEEEVERLRGIVASGFENFSPDHALDSLTAYIRGLERKIANQDAMNAQLIVQFERREVALDSECAAKVDLIREVMTKFQNGEIKVLRAMSDISDVLEA